MSGKLVYLACPYTHPDPHVREQRFQAANLCASFLVRAGVVLFSPISHAHPIAQHGLRMDWEYWKFTDQMMIERSDALLVMVIDGWEDSVGVKEEIRLAIEKGIPIGYLHAPDNEAVVINCIRKAGLMVAERSERDAEITHQR